MKNEWPKVFAHVGIAVMGFVLAYYATWIANGGIAAGLMGRTDAGLELLTTANAALLVGVSMFAVFGYLALKLAWPQVKERR